MESLKASGLGKWLLFQSCALLHHESGLLHSSVKVPVRVLCAALHGQCHIRDTDIVSGGFWFSIRIYVKKTFWNFCFSVLRLYIFLILCEVVNNKGDRNTFPCCLENVYFWTRSWPTYIHSVACRNNIGFHKFSVSLRHQLSSKSSSWSQPALN